MKIIGLTGSIGMGKSETAKIFAEQGIPVFDSDATVHNLLGPDGAAVEAVEEKFPGVKVDNYIDRKRLGDLVFGDEAALRDLENILHPLVIKERQTFLENSKSDIIVFDIPLLFEKNYQDQCDFIVVVSAPFKIQKERVLKRPGMSEERFMEINQKQMPDAEKRKRADFIIQTDKGLSYAKKQVTEIIKNIRKFDA
ncbi:MAG: dephospho-CoA kinase [Alphaproteobacteria bacterium]|nr:dephospho-CoA kinase [Alphaproteobacteria bacterium]HPF46398.1 dephospho-CoA kinase [Emcibacteraceae bacterium]